MEKTKIERINFLAKKAKESAGLTESERIEQHSLRQEYLSSVRINLVSRLENTYIVDDKGNRKKISRKE